MIQNKTNRLSRLTAILLQLQTKRIVTATSLAEKFQVSVRTIYRDLKTLEEAGVPLITEEGKGYSLMEGYRIPPVMFTEREANALIITEQLVYKNSDSSLITDYLQAIDKIKAVLRTTQKDKSNLLSDRTRNNLNIYRERNSNYLSDLQFAITNSFAVEIDYTNETGNYTNRILEPFALLSTDNWILLAYCRLRKDFRYFRLDRIEKLHLLSEEFDSLKMTLQEYFNKFH